MRTCQAGKRSVDLEFVIDESRDVDDAEIVCDAVDEHGVGKERSVSELSAGSYVRSLRLHSPGKQRHDGNPCGKDARNREHTQH